MCSHSHPRAVKRRSRTVARPLSSSMSATRIDAISVECIDGPGRLTRCALPLLIELVDRPLGGLVALGRTGAPLGIRPDRGVGELVLQRPKCGLGGLDLALELLRLPVARRRRGL